jgi:hypothetical protein
MTKGYIIYKSFYYYSEYLKQIDDTLGEMVCDNQWYEDKREGELLQMNDKMCMIKRKSLNFCQISIE